MSKLKSLREALAVSPVNVPLLMLYAQACIDELSFEEARKSFEKVLSLEPTRVEAKLGIAQVLQLTGRISEAIVRTEGLVQENARLAEGWLLLSRLEIADGDRLAATEHYRKAVQLRPALKDMALENLLRLPKRPLPGLKSESEEGEEWRSDSELEEDLPNEGFLPAVGGSIEQPDRAYEDDREISDEMSRPAISFADVGGMEDVKQEIRMKIIYPLQNRDLFRAYGKKLGGGVLLYGPPGCGKTLISRATAGEIRANFISVALHQILDLYIGNSEKNLHQLFQMARNHAPAVLFFDEVDALAADRKDLRESGMRTLINQFLAEMDGNVGNNDGLLVLGATNAPWHLDPAFRRPGRFDRIVFIPPPDEDARIAIIELMAKEKPVQRLDIATLARKTKGFSGADIKAMFDITTEHALSRAMREGRLVPLTTEDLLQAAREIRPSTRGWFESAKNYALYANQSGFYDDVLSFLNLRK
ncbi:MAG: AAA family ATPase [Verrucomicrobia bacterium]|nr:AAA family ATPase [Verrucomicrobiota bacterium]